MIQRSDKERGELQRRVEQQEVQERLKLEREAEDRQRFAGKLFFLLLRKIQMLKKCGDCQMINNEWSLFFLTFKKTFPLQKLMMKKQVHHLAIDR